MKLYLKLTKWPSLLFLSGLLAGFFLLMGGNFIMKKTSTDEYCMSCHIHPHAEVSWKKSTHYYNKSGIRVHCVECHLPPKEEKGYLIEKARTGLKDIYGFYFRDSASFDWENKRLISHAVKIVYNKSCISCHQTIFSKDLSTEGGIAHLYYETNTEKLKLQCINCHLDAGHFNPDYVHGKMKVAASKVGGTVFKEPARITRFENFTEQIPNTTVSFKMMAVRGGTFKMGSPDNEPFRRPDEGPVRTVKVSSFFMGETEVSWDEYWSFFAATMSEGRMDPVLAKKQNESGTDAISGPTPPFGIPDQGWGGGTRPAITMTHYAAGIYCQWLSKVTGKKYRLPTEAEWEYACRGGTETPYFFEGDPKRLTESKLLNRIFRPDTTRINRYVVYSMNSSGRSRNPEFIQPNPWGLRNMTGNVMEFCSDWYSEDAYSATGLNITDPHGPEEGTERVVRGGDFSFDPKDLRSARRDKTRSIEWMVTDPQNPKSIWWYSDVKGIGFRVVCEKEVP